MSENEFDNNETEITLYTPYQCAKIVNEWLSELEISKVIPPQMMYTYTKKNMIVSTEIEGKKFVSLEDLENWFRKYVNKLRTPSKSLVIPSCPKV